MSKELTAMQQLIEDLRDKTWGFEQNRFNGIEVIEVLKKALLYAAIRDLKLFCQT